ncbi:MAG: hypothetical protein IJQ50_05620, partial [Clostridia bacterium]|nr:hypothetical protein [Clostridia bacterium]
MINQRIEMKLPDETLLIAEATEDSDYPCISIYHKDTECSPDEVVFAEYNPEKPIGRKLMAGAYQNNDDDTRYYKSFHYAFKPSFKELYQVFTDSRMNDFCLVRDEDFYEIIRNCDNLAVCRDFSYDNEKFGHHTGHKITLAGYGGENGIENLSFECLDCNEVLYSVDRVKPLKDVYRMVQPNSLSRIVGFVNDNDKLKECGCIGFSKISFESDGKRFKSEWTDKNEQLRTEKFTEVYNELVNDYLSYNLLKSAGTMWQYCTDSEHLMNFSDGKYVTQIVADDYTFFVVLIPNGNESKAQIFAYANE